MTKKLKTKPVILLKLELSDEASVTEVKDFLRVILRGLALTDRGTYVKKVVIRSVDYD